MGDNRLVWLALLISIELIEIHGPDGQVAYVNTHEISSLRAPTHRDLADHFTKGARCIVVTTNGKFIAATETCETVKEMIDKVK